MIIIEFPTLAKHCLYDTSSDGRHDNRSAQKLPLFSFRTTSQHLVRNSSSALQTCKSLFFFCCSRSLLRPHRNKHRPTTLSNSPHSTSESSSPHIEATRSSQHRSSTACGLSVSAIRALAARCPSTSELASACEQRAVLRSLQQRSRHPRTSRAARNGQPTSRLTNLKPKSTSDHLWSLRAPCGC